jgi:two-component system, LytTR family, sensor kinase
MTSRAATSGGRLPFRRRYLFHLLFWVMYAVFIFLETKEYARHKSFVFSLAPVGIFFLLTAFVVYGNMLVLIPLALQKKRAWLYVAGVVFLIATYTILRSMNQLYWDAVVWPDEKMRLTDYTTLNFAYSIWFILISTMLFFTQQWAEQQQRMKNIEINQLQTELKYLRSQVNPHFLFNGLNTIYGNIDIRDQEARDVVVRFSNLLRYNLYEAAADLVPLEKEAGYLADYVQLQKARSNPDLGIDLEVSMEDPTAAVAPLILLPFVENAFKYCTRDDGRVNFVRIGLRQNGRRLIFTCANSCEDRAAGTGGIGLVNARRRLELLYKDRHRLRAEKEGDQYIVELIIEL